LNAHLLALETRLDGAARQLADSIDSARRCVARHRVAFALAGGFAGGVAVSLLPQRAWQRVSAILRNIAFGALRMAFWSFVAKSPLARRSTAADSCNSQGRKG